MDAESTALFRARVPTSRLRKAEEILARLGMKPGDAFNMLLAQIELREGLPFEVSPPVRRCSGTPNSKPSNGKRLSLPTEPKPGEVWFAELSIVEKRRPVWVLAFPGSQDARSSPSSRHGPVRLMIFDC